MAFKVNENAFEKRKEMLSAGIPSLGKEGTRREERGAGCSDSRRSEPAKPCGDILLTPSAKEKKDAIFSVAITRRLKDEIDRHVEEAGWKNRNEFMNELLSAYFGTAEDGDRGAGR